MKIFYSGNQYNYYDPAKGLSFEHENFYVSLKNMPGVEVVYFPFERILEIGKRAFNEEILEAVKRERPDALFVFMMSDEFEPAVLREINSRTTSIAWFADDSWRFYNYSRAWARHFTWAVTTYSWMPELYKEAGQPNVIRSQWAVNTAVYKPVPVGGVGGPAVSFVGGWTKPRARIISRLMKAGVPVDVYGRGWPNDRVSSEEMMRIFGMSKINLGLNPAPGFWNVNSLGRILFRRSRERIVSDLHLIRNLRVLMHRNIPQIKARHFEIPACRGFLMTSMADDLGSFYKIGKEVVIYGGLDDCAKKIKYYLGHPEEREAIAQAGYERTVRDHTYVKRFEKIFAQAGIDNGH
jgi:spore maturation protein CgeB